MNSLHAIEKLHEGNYPSWAVQMKSILVHLELWGVASGNVVLGSEPKPEELAAFVAKDEKALASIMLCIKPTQINHVIHCKTALSAWNKLKEIYQPSGPVRKITLFKKLLHNKVVDSGSISQYINDFCETVEQLAQIGVNFVDELLVIILLSNLPESYENFVVAIETRDTLPTMSILKTKLFEEETRRNERGDQNASNSSHQAFVAKGNNSNNSSESTKRNNNSGSSTNSRNKSNVKCYNCGRRGHFASKCRDAKNKAEKTATSFNMVNSGGKSNWSEQMWCIDSGATCHLCCDRKLFSEFKVKSEKVIVAGNKHIIAEGSGRVKIDSGQCVLNLENVLYVPELQFNFISVDRAVKSGLKVFFDKNKAVIKNKQGRIILSAGNTDGLFIFSNKNYNSCFTAKGGVSLHEWHERYGHLNFDSLLKMINKNIVNGLNVNDKSIKNCLTCAKAKICVQPFPVSESRSKELLDIVHSDICGPMKNVSIGGARYFMTFIDDMSRYIHVYFIKRKDEALEIFKQYKAMTENETGKKIKTLRTDNGGEYTCKNFANFLSSSGIKHELTVPYTPQQNGVAERANRTLTEMARCMLIHSALDESLWAEAIATAVYLRNRSETRALSAKTPFEMWTGRVPSVKHLKLFGSLAVLLDKTHRYKFQPKGREVIMVGYATTTKGYRLYDPETRKVTIGRDVIFLNSMYNPQEQSPTDLILLETEVVDYSNDETPEANENVEKINQQNENVEQISQQNENVEQINQSNENDEQINQPNDNVTIRYRPGRPKSVRTGKVGRPRKVQQVLSCTKNIVEPPKNLREAMGSEYRNQWLESMKQEIDALKRNNTWSLVDLPENEFAIGCKWVYNIKKNADGSIQKLKSRLVAKGCAQKFGVNYNETFSPVVRYETIRMIVALAAEHNLHLHQMDVSSAYLNSELKDTVYMKQPEQFVNEQFPNKVCKLNKALYGLKQSGREWNEKLDSVLKKIGFIPCASEPCVYTKNNAGRFNIIAVYVDDLLLASSCKEDIEAIKQQIEQNFDVTHGGQLHYFLGMQFVRNGETGDISVYQKKYIEDILEEIGMVECNAVSTPMDPGFQVTCNDENCQKVNKTEYQSLIGALMYLALSTRPDILHATCKLAQCNMDPHKEHWTAAKRILRYLNGTKELKLHYHKTNQPVTCYVDADWGGDTSDRKSFTGYVFIVAGGVFAWQSKKQNIIALSSTEAEYVALSSAAKEAIYIEKMMGEMGFDCQTPIVLNGDNQSAQHLVKNPVFHNRSKHIDIRFHHIRELYKQNKIQLKYCPTDKMMSDILTKNLAKVKLGNFTKEMGIF